MSRHDQYRLIKLAITVLSWFPKDVLMFISKALSRIWYMIDKRHRNVVLDNVDSAFPGRFSQPQLKRFAKKNFDHVAGILFEVIWSYSKKNETLFRHFSIRGIENIEKARQKGKGVIMLAGHMGNFELMSVAMGKTGINPYGLYRKMDYRPLEKLLKEIRERFGTKMIPLRKASKKVEALLKDGEVVGTLLDQNVDWYKGVFVDYFSRPACTNNGLAKLVIRTGCSVVPMFIRKERDRYILEFLPEIEIAPCGDLIKDVENITQQFVSAIEYMVLHEPVQYFWVHNRWKTKPYCLIERQA